MSIRVPERTRQYGLIDALIGRRSRRFALGMTIPDGPLAYRSRYEPMPLSASERTLLAFSAAGVTGWNLGMPHTASGAPEEGANYPMRFLGRTAPSAAGIESSEVLIADDSGTYITQTRNLSAEQIQRVADARSFDELLEHTADHLVRISSERLSIPPISPLVSAHNQWNALQPGTTLLAPVLDMTEETLSFLSIVTGEGAILWDVTADEPVGRPQALIDRGVLHAEARLPLEAFESLVAQQASVESGLMAYNGQLMLQAMGLGGWLFGGIDANVLLGARAADGIPGFGFSFTEAGGLPNPVGLAEHFETLAAPFASGPEEIVRRFSERKFGPRGTYERPGVGPYVQTDTVAGAAARYDDDTLEYFVSVVDGVLRRFGRFPGMSPTVLTSVYLQAQHVDEEYYDTVHPPGSLLATHRSHMDDWHDRSAPAERTGR